MAEQKKDKSANDKKKSSDEKPLPYSGGVLTIIGLAFTFTFRILMIIFIAIAIEVVLTALGLYDDGVNHAQKLLLHYYQFLIDDHSSKKYVIDPLNNALDIINYLSSLLSINLQDSVTKVHTGFIAYMYVIYFSVCVVLIKLSYVVSSLPLFALVWICMIMDGFVQRTKRKYIGTPDSVYKWTISVHMIGVPLFGIMLLFLVLPFSIHPAFWLLPITFLCGLGWRAVTINFNKFV
ncbi:DUF4400 domain-containing protein [Photobacterium leiognathi]|uniref:DUF4400 domain-containing protein n=1 Tax=Photobacterium leiognathi TaxID=553611 RepID=UPI0029824CFA|nr:DUF4400 domain-containing protein [Photobacterium leiognathi]